MNFYLASRYSRKAEMQQHAQALQAMGHTVTSRWIDGSHDCDGDCTPEQFRQFADEDGHDIINAHVFVCFTESSETTGYTSGGRHVELGLALGIAVTQIVQGITSMGIVIVGPRENVFHYLDAVVQFETFDEFLHAVQKADELADLLTAPFAS